MPTPAEKAIRYGPNHRRTRARYQRRLDQGETIPCWRCGTPLDADSTWHLGHDDHDPTTHRGPECVPCNTSTAAARGNRARAAPRASTLRW